MNGGDVISSNLPLSDIQTGISFISQFVTLLKLLKDAREKKKLKDILWRLIEDDVKRAETAVDRLSDAVILAFGANFFYSLLFEPLDPDAKAKQLIENISRNYHELLESIRSLSKTILTYQDEFKELFSPAEWVYIKGILSAVKEKKIDTELLSRQVKVWPIFHQTKNQLHFQQKFSEYLNEFNKQTGLDELNHRIGLKDKEYREFVAKFLERCLKEFFAESKKFKSKQKSASQKSKETI
ncbi:BAR domain-containing protein [Pyrococcus yayanosii]|uniref:Uncharacterized protein n=1 Tax=Pyrococcus yayanosii (strain CH1 / JCM 16557) TaxID=529709 RepID=F8AIZ1_PYRYC|nr:hypothetical protein [Pyrococcus yayanosii]AEH24467.1 hypothetical protein PYCH_07820 [Pyrococcus yayanosii CH1]